MRQGHLVLGGIIGDIAGSAYEFDNYRAKDFDMFADYHGHKCFATDDSIMTLAVCKALVESAVDFNDLPENTIKWMRKVGRPYPGCGYGGRFMGWMYSDTAGPYNSFGNGAAMRVSGAAYAAKTLEQAERLAEVAAGVTHNHPEGLKGARVTAGLVWLALNGSNKAEMREYAEKTYNLDFTIDGIRPTYRFNETCQNTVPQAIEAFLEAEDFEDAIRTAISVGGDSDTLACITGSIAGPFFGIPDDMKAKAEWFLDKRLTDIYQEFSQRF